MKGILVATGVDVEARGLARHLGLERAPTSDHLHFRGSGVDLVCVGPGAGRLDGVTALARAASVMVSAGTCGALALHLARGDVVVPQAVLTPRGHRHPLPALVGLPQAGTLLTVEAVVATAVAKARLWRETAALAVDMESSIIVEWAAALGLPAVAVRGVVDTAVDGVSAALAGVVDGRGRTRMRRAAQVVLTRPGALPQALALHRGTAAALARVAAALRPLIAHR